MEVDSGKGHGGGELMGTGVGAQTGEMGKGLISPPENISVSVLQARLRNLFRAHPPTDAMAMALAEIGNFMDGIYMTLHARFGETLYTDEWVWEGFEVADQMRSVVTEAMTGATTHQRSRCIRIGTVEELAPAVVKTPVYDAKYELTCAVAVVVGRCDRD